MSEPMVLINVFEVPASDAEKFIAAWEEARDFLKERPGYIDTSLHQAISPDAEFQFINVAHWRTAGEFVAATQNPAFRQVTADMAGYRARPALYRVVRS